jgi:hypothetical protein
MVYYEDGAEEDIVDQNANPPHSELLAYFDAVSLARTAEVETVLDFKKADVLTYLNMPRHYTLNKLKGKSVWNPRQKHMGQFSSIGRIYQITPSAKNLELYFLRSLLTRRQGMASFEELRTYEGITYSTFKETIKAMGLLKDDMEWKDCLQEMSSCTTNKRLLREKLCTDINLQFTI